MKDNKSRFAYLLERYFEDQATAEEMNELITLARQGNYDDELKPVIDAYLENDKGDQDMAPWEAQQVLQNILSESEKTKVVQLQPSHTWKWVAAAAVVIIAVTTGILTLQNRIEPDQNMAHTQRVEPSAFSGKQFVHLPDGSTVLLNDNSQLTYSASFGGQTREVILKGEAFFDIQHDPTRPFKVITGDVITTVLGTAFNVSAYAGQPEIKVTVTRGKVQVGDDKTTFGIITPDQQIAVNTTTHEFVQTSLSAASETTWVSKSLILDNVSMETAATLIEARYNAKIIFSRNELKTCRITAEFLNGENLDEVMEVVCAVVQATYTQQPDGNIRLEGKGCR